MGTVFTSFLLRKKYEPILSPERESNPRLRPYQGRVLPLNHLGNCARGGIRDPASPDPRIVTLTIEIVVSIVLHNIEP